MAKIVFYCNDTISNLQKMEYYCLDIKALEDIGHDVIICNKYTQIPMRFDAIYIYWWTYALFPVLLAKLKGKPAYISGVFNYSFPEWQEGIDYSARPLWQRCLMRWSMKLADANLVVSLSDFDKCSSAFNLSNAHYTPCCIGDEYFEINSNANTQNLMNLSWAGLGNLKRKGIFDIISALKIVKDKGYEFNLKLAGTLGDGIEALEKTIVINGLQKQVEHIGEISKDTKLALLQSSSIYVQPSNYEGFGLASAEAMAAGLRVIACDVGDVRNTLGDHATYVENGNITEIAEKIIELLNCEIDVGEISSAKKFLASKYSYQKKLFDIQSILKL
jgi:glycosyltransferase involved in cell wall biosynthesis